MELLREKRGLSWIQTPLFRVSNWCTVMAISETLHSAQTDLTELDRINPRQFEDKQYSTVPLHKYSIIDSEL